MAKVRMLIELVLLLTGSVAAGVLIGTAQHFVSFGVRGWGFGKGPLEVAGFEGGIVGAYLGIPTGLIVYYAVLRRRLTPKGTAIILGGSLAGGCLLGATLFWLSAFVTPMLTIGIAYWVGRHAGASGPAAAKE